MSNLKEIREVYYCCHDCLTKAGGKPIAGHCFTASLGDCEVCGAKDVTLIPWVDYSWPKDKKADWVAKSVRD